MATADILGAVKARKKGVLFALDLVVAAAVSSAITYNFARKKFNAEMDNLIEAEVSRALDFAKSIDVQTDLDEKSDDEVTDEVSEPKFVGTAVAEKPPVEELVAPILMERQKTEYHKLAGNYASDEGGEDELAPEEPAYSDPNFVVLSKDIFFENESEFPQSQLSVFADGAVLDEDGDFVADFLDLIGPGPYPFGDMSEDPLVVYMRNVSLQREFELTFDEQDSTDFIKHSVDPPNLDISGLAERFNSRS